MFSVPLFLRGQIEALIAHIEPIKALLGDWETYSDAIECLQKTHPTVLHEIAKEANAILLGKGTGQVLGSLMQANVAEAIGNMNNPGPLLVNKLIALLDWPYGRVSMKAEQALVKLGIKAV